MSQLTIQDVLTLFSEADVSVPAQDLDPALPLLEQGLDSLDMMNVYFLIEEKYQISVDENSISDGKWDTLERILQNLNA